MPAELEQLTFDVGSSAANGPRALPDSDPVKADVAGSLAALAVAADQAENGVSRSRALLQLTAAVDEALTAAIADAYSTRSSWRKLSADLGVPFQTLHRRYAATVER